MDERALRHSIDTAKDRLSEAKDTMELVLRELRVLPRAEKKTISSVVEAAFQKLRVAQAELEKLEALIPPPSSER